MKKNNATCVYCGKPYFVCRSCIDLYSWKQVCDTPECYRKHIEKVNAHKKEEKAKTFKEPAKAEIERKPIKIEKSQELQD